MSNGRSLAIRSRQHRDPGRRAGNILALVFLTGVAAGVGGLLGQNLVETVRVSLERQSSEREAATEPDTTNAPATGTIVKIKPVVTNLAAPRDVWVRLGASLVLGTGTGGDEAMRSHIEQDIVAYLRTVTLAQIEGAVGLQHLREDLNERAAIRSNGAVRELIIESLVVQ